MSSLRSSQFLKTIVQLIFTTQKVNACSPWTACSVFNWKYLFWANLVRKLKIMSLNWNFIPTLIQICRITWWCSLFLFSTGNTMLCKFDPKSKNYQFELKFCTRLIWICRIIWKICGFHFFCFRQEKPFLDKSGQKNQNCQLQWIFCNKRLIWVFLFQITKIVSLSWNFAID